MTPPKDTLMTPPRWTNQHLVLYHGTIVSAALAIEAGKTNVAHGNSNKDFGRGFYTTTVRTQAEEWARRLILRRRRAGLPYEQPALVVLTIPRGSISSLLTMSFTLAERTSEDFWSFVRHCRSKAINHALLQGGVLASYDVIFGPLVSDWTNRETYKNCDQVSFHTQSAQSLLNKDSQRTMMKVA